MQILLCRHLLPVCISLKGEEGAAGKPKHCSVISGIATTLKNMVPQQAVRIMKLTAIILLAACLQVQATGYGQKVTLSLKDAPLEKLFTEIKKQTGYKFLYINKLVDNAKKITIHVNEAYLDDVLRQCFKEQPFDYEIKEKTIIVRAKNNGSGFIQANDEQKLIIDVKGKVVNAKGEPVAGATVTVQGTRKSTITDANGEFSLVGVDDDAVIQITHVQYEIENITLNGKGIVNATLQIKVSSLDEMQVIAYGTTTKRLNTGNVATVKAEDIAKQPVSNPLQALQGRVPGMFITQQTGVPGGSYKVEIRGRNSINPAIGNYPFYIIDGVPYSAQLLPNIGYSIIGEGNPLNFINPSSIESIDILKDADATAIYGSRGANGVVLITTKKAKNGPTKIDVNFYKGIGKVTRHMDLLNTEQYLQVRKEAFQNDGALPGAWDNDINGTWDTTMYTDLQKVLIGGTAKYTDVQVSLSGGNANTRFLIGGGYHKETTVFPGDFADQKASVNFNINSASLNQKFKMNFTGNYIADVNNLLNYDLTNSTTLAPNVPPLYNLEGELNWANGTWDNPLAIQLQKYKSRSNNLVGTAFLSYQIISGLEIRTSLGYTNMVLNEKRMFPTSSFNPAYNVGTGRADFSTNNLHSWIIEPQASYELKLGKGILNALLGTTIQENISSGEIINGQGYTNDALLGSLQAAASINKGTITDLQYKYNALFGRLHYNSLGKYLINLTARRDGSSRFGPGKQFANFAAIGSGWIFSKESFVKRTIPFLSFGKLRASYGTSGNDQIGDYRYLSLYNFTGNNPYQGGVGLYPNNLFNADFAWEVNKKFEVGLDLGFFNDRLLFNISYYRNSSSNQLIGNSLPDITGFTNVTANLPAHVQNSGWEIIVNSSNILNRNFRWTSNFNLTIPNNKLVSFPNFETSPYRFTYEIGQPLTIKRVYHLVDVDPATGVYRFTDENGNKTFNPTENIDNNTIINTAPKLYGAIQNNFQFRGIQLDFLFQFVKQIGRNYLFDGYYTPGMSGYFNFPSYVLNRWNKPGDIAPIQKYTQDFASNAFVAYQKAQMSDYAYSDASFIRLKNLSLSYQLSEKLQRQMHIQNCRIYFQGQNLVTITNYKGMDPENQSTSILPPLKVFTFGVQFTL